MAKAGINLQFRMYNAELRKQKHKMQNVNLLNGVGSNTSPYLNELLK